MKKYLVDTCGWIEWLTNSSLGNSFEFYLKQLPNLCVPTLLQFELYKWVSREKNNALALEIIGLTEQGIVIPLDSQLALFAADNAKENNLAMADAIIYSTAQLNHAELITCDQHFAKLPGVKFISKNK